MARAALVRDHAGDRGAHQCDLEAVTTMLPKASSKMVRALRVMLNAHTARRSRLS